MGILKNLTRNSSISNERGAKKYVTSGKIRPTATFNAAKIIRLTARKTSPSRCIFMGKRN